MKLLARIGIAILFVLISTTLGLAQSHGKSATTAAAAPPQDKPVSASSNELKNIEEAIKPSIEKAKKTYPDAKKRYLAGLPAGQKFYITTRLRDSQGRFEQSFIEVKEIKDGVVKGIIANEIELVSGFQAGDSYSFPETELIDWTITRPDGSEEGNFVGKFLDEYQKQQ